MSDFKFDQFKISILSFLIVSCQIVASELFSSSSDLMQGGGGQLESIFTGYVPQASQNPYPLYSILLSIKDSILITFANMVQLLNR